MTVKSTAGFILHKRPYRNTSLLLDVFTREFGVLRAIMRGGKKQQHLQLYTPIWFELNLKNELAIAYKAEAKQACMLFCGKGALIGFYVNELIMRMLYPYDPQPGIYNQYQSLLLELNQDVLLAIQAHLRQFELYLLKELGYGLCFSREAIKNESIIPTKNYRFIAGQGFINSPQGISGEVLLAIDQGNWQDKTVLKVAKYVLRHAISHALGGRELKSRVYEDLSGFCILAPN